MSPRSTAEVAALIGVHRATLEEWISKGKVERPQEIKIGRRTLRLWASEDIKKLREYKNKSYQKGRGRKERASGPGA